MVVGRRALLLALAAVAPVRADTADQALTCDTTLGPALNKAAAYAARTSVQVFVFPTGPGLIAPQLRRDIQNDIVVTQVPILQQIARNGDIIAASDGQRWRNQLVIAGPRDGAALDQSFGACDLTPALDMDGPALLTRLGLKPARVLGAVDTDEVAFLLTTGAAQAGLLHMTDVRADARLTVIRVVPPEVMPSPVYGASVTRLSHRPNPDGFLAFMASGQGAALLSEGGLEAQT